MTPTPEDVRHVPCPWNQQAEPFRDIFNAALTGILANPSFFTSHQFQGDPVAAVEFADRVVMAAITDAPK
jgi:hypothetical protein